MSSEELYQKILALSTENESKEEPTEIIETLGYGPKPSGTHHMFAKDGVFKLRVVDNKFFIRSESN